MRGYLHSLADIRGYWHCFWPEVGLGLCPCFPPPWLIQPDGEHISPQWFIYLFLFFLKNAFVPWSIFVCYCQPLLVNGPEEEHGSISKLPRKCCQHRLWHCSLFLSFSQFFFLSFTITVFHHFFLSFKMYVFCYLSFSTLANRLWLS